MWNNSSNNINKIDNLVSKYGKEGLELLIFFKLLKTKLIEQLKTEHPSKELKIDKNIVNNFCIQKAHQMIIKKKDNITEDDVKEIIREIYKEE